MRFNLETLLDPKTYGIDNESKMKNAIKLATDMDTVWWEQGAANLDWNMSMVKKGSYPDRWVSDFYDKYKGVCLVCGAGPSLHKNIDHIKARYNDGCPIIAVDRAFIYLKQNGIKPILTVTVDVQDCVLGMYRSWVEADDNVALIATCSKYVSAEANYGDIYWYGHVLPLSPFWNNARKKYGDKIALTRAGYVVTFTAIDIAYWMGFDTIVTIGNELCFRPEDGESLFEYAKDGFPFRYMKFGNVLSSDAFIRTANCLSLFPRMHEDCDFIDASCGIVLEWDKHEFMYEGEAKLLEAQRNPYNTPPTDVAKCFHDLAPDEARVDQGTVQAQNMNEFIENLDSGKPSDYQVDKKMMEVAL